MFRLGQMFGQGIELLFPEAPVVRDPIRGALHCSRLQAATAHAAVFCRADQAGALEDVQMLRESGKGNRKGCGQIADARLAAREARQDGAANGVGERGKGGVKRRR